MKKLAFLLVLACLLGCACAEEVNFQPLHVSLWADSDAGYEWTCEYDDNGVFAAPMEEIVTLEEGCNYDYYFGVEKAGNVEIIFNYGVNWDMAAPEKTIIYNVTVDETGANSIRAAETYSDDCMIVISLPSNPTTGWGWSYQGESEGSGMVSLVAESYEPANAFLEGAGGTATFQLKVEKPGDTVLLFNHSNLWDPNAPAQESYAVIVSANEDMEISIEVEC